MPRPERLLPGDVLLYRKRGILGNLISWGEWSGKPGEAYEYAHVGLVLDAEHSVEMNPPASRSFLLVDVPWNHVDVFRVKLLGDYPFADDTCVKTFQAEARRRLGERYHYGYIATSLGVSLLGRVGLPGAARWLMSRANPFPGKHRDICSTWAEEVLTVGVQAVVEQFDLFPDLGSNRARPADYPLSPYLIRV